MTTLELEFFGLYSSQIEGLFTMTDSEGERVCFDGDTYRDYVNPLDFEKKIRNLPSSLWAPEFRQARDIIHEYAEQYGNYIIESLPDVSAYDVLASCMADIRLLAKMYVPQILGELEPLPISRENSHGVFKTEREQKKELFLYDLSLDADRHEIELVFGALVHARYLDEFWQPTNGAATMKERAYMAKLVGKLLQLEKFYKRFTLFWEGEYTDAYKSALGKGYPENTKEINAAVLEGIKVNERLYNSKIATDIRNNKKIK